MRNFWFVLTLLPVLLLSQSLAVAQDSDVSLSSNYFEMSKKYDSLSFDVGPRLIAESPDSARYRDLVIAAHDGRPRVGVLDDYGASEPTTNYDARNAKQQVTKRLTAELEALHGLLALRFARKHFTPEILLHRDPNQRPGFQQVASTYPTGFAAALAGNLVNDQIFGDYFCGGRAGCAEAQYRPMFQLSPRITASVARRWGGANDEFAAREAIETFIEKDLGNFIEWSDSLPLEAAFVGQVVLPEYDFSKKGFAFQIMPPNDAGPRSSSLGYLHWELADAAVKVLSADGYSTQAFLPMSPADAEQLTETAKRPGRASLVYFVLEGAFYNVDSEQPGFRSVRGFRLLYELTSPIVTFYGDSALTIKLGTATMAPQ